MLLIHCPFCDAPRPEPEFRYAGEAHLDRPYGYPDCFEDEWGEFLYGRSNTKGVHAERWRHIHGCGRYFNALRDTVSDKFVATYKPGEKKPAIGWELPR